MNSSKRLSKLISVSLLLLSACNSMPNYIEPNEPLFMALYSTPHAKPVETIKIVTWNIKFAEAIDEAIVDLTTVEEIKGADILLLQEMDEAGVERIASALHYNYVYFPMSLHSQTDRNFGNAVLSPWLLSEPQKIIYPHENPRNGQIRGATRVVVTIGEVSVLAYSTHTETYWLDYSKRLEQIDAVITDIAEFDSDYVVIGGDFNTGTTADIIALEEKFSAINMERISAGAGYTMESRFVSLVLDHFFAKGMTPLERGVWSNTVASDHYPLWVTVTLNNREN